MPENQDGHEKKMSLAKASAISWALESTPSSTGSEWNDASEQKFVRPGLDQTGHSVRVRVIGWPQGTPAAIRTARPWGSVSINQPGGFCLWPYKVKGSFLRVPLWLFEKPHLSSRKEPQMKDDRLLKWYSRQRSNLPSPICPPIRNKTKKKVHLPGMNLQSCWLPNCVFWQRNENIWIWLFMVLFFFFFFATFQTPNAEGK